MDKVGKQFFAPMKIIHVFLLFAGLVSRAFASGPAAAETARDERQMSWLDAGLSGTAGQMLMGAALILFLAAILRSLPALNAVPVPVRRRR